MTSVVCTLLCLSTVLQISMGGGMGPTTPQPSDYAQCRLSDELKEEFVDLHNKFRGEVQPSAADMEFMEWNDDLGNLAQMWSDKCERKHGFTKFGAWYPNQLFRNKSVGQNLALKSGKWVENKKAGPEASVRLWSDEKNYYTFVNISSRKPRSMCLKNKICGHYTQVVWAKSKQIGCAFNWCDKPSKTVVTCDYYRRGNVRGQPPYKPGTPCTKCASGQGWCYKNLCRECKNFSPKCGSTYTKSMCRTKRDLMEKKCPHMCNLCQCAMQCKNGGQVDRKTCTCKCYGKWKGMDCSERICDEGWYGENCDLICRDKKTSCGRFVKKGYCVKIYAAWMKENCRKSCNKCT